ncbi:MAG: DUF4932 domain-containing protein [Mariniphaga sp.]
MNSCEDNINEGNMEETKRERNCLKNLWLYLFILVVPGHLLAQYEHDRVNITVNKNFELFYAMYLSSDADSIFLANRFSGFSLLTQHNFKLKRNFFDAFSEYKNSPQVKFYNQLVVKGFGFGGALNVLLRVDQNLNIVDSCFFDEHFPMPKEAKPEVLKFLTRLKEYSELTNFEEFYKQQQPEYDAILKIHSQKVHLPELVSSIENFFGQRISGYQVTLLPMMWPGGMSLEYKKDCADSLREIHICIGPKDVDADRPVFGPDEKFKAVITHEFIHPFVMDHCLIHREEIEQYAYWYQKHEDVYRNNGCPDWFAAVNEELTRTVEIIITSGDDPEKANKAIEHQSNKLGFPCIPVFYHAFKKYYSPTARKDISLDTVFADIIRSLD